MTPAAPILTVKQVAAGYDGTEILSDVSLSMPQDEIFAVIGPNGSGKSTLAKVIAGLIPASRGEIQLAGVPVTRLPAWERLRAGVAYVPQEHNVFLNMTVEENLRIVAEHASAKPAEFAIKRECSVEMFPELSKKMGQRSGLLSGGQRQLLAFACALIADPKILILDEPSAGLSPRLTSEIMSKVAAIHRSGVAVFMIEQNVMEALRVADRVLVLVNGRMRLLAKPAEFGPKYNLHEVYLG